jgi:hypothetical protein
MGKDLPEVQRLGGIVHGIQGSQPASPLVELIMERLRRLEEYRRFGPSQTVAQ